MRRTTRRWCLLFGAAIAGMVAVGRGDDGVAWLDVVADSPVEHAVMIRGPFADAHERVTLSGPVGFVANGVDGGFAAYRVAGSADRVEHTARLNAARVQVRLGPVEFLVVPAKRLVEGAPARAAGRGVYEVRPILDAPDAIAALPATAGRPTHLCLPADYRHHFDRVPVEAAGRGLVVGASQAIEPRPPPVRIADDFGLNRLVPAGTRRAGGWIDVDTAAGR
jgi:hypothetical protein